MTHEWFDMNDDRRYRSSQEVSKPLETSYRNDQVELHVLKSALKKTNNIVDNSDSKLMNWWSLIYKMTVD